MIASEVENPDLLARARNRVRVRVREAVLAVGGLSQKGIRKRSVFLATALDDIAMLIEDE